MLEIDKNIEKSRTKVACIVTRIGIFFLSWILIGCNFGGKGLEAEYPFNGNLNDYVSAEVGIPIGDIKFEKTDYSKGVKFTQNKTFSLIKLQNTRFSEKEYTLSFFASFKDFKKNNSLIFFGNKKESWGNSGLWVYTEGSKIAICQEGQSLIKKDYKIKNSINSIFLDSKKLETDTMYFFTITYSNSNLKLYNNGVLDSYYTNVKPFKAENRNVLIGVANDPKAKYKFQFGGVIDELKIYSKGLTQEDVMELYKSYNKPN